MGRVSDLLRSPYLLGEGEWVKEYWGEEGGEGEVWMKEGRGVIS